MFGDFVESSANAYATVAKANHEITWWAVILAGMLIMQALRLMKSEHLQDLTPALQKSIAAMLNLVIAFSVMLIMIQFHVYWMPLVERVIDFVFG